MHGADVAEAARDHDRLVKAKARPADVLLIDTKIAAEIGRPNSLLNAAPPIGPSA
jgi:hypothetical protein